jgi:3-methyladenine DNA glycosylase AlkD
MTANEIIASLRALGSESYKRVIMKHGIIEPVFGVSVAELKKIQKQIKKDYQLALDLYDSGIYDARYLAGLIADDLKMSKRDLQHWALTSNCPSNSEYTVAWAASESRYGRELALTWIEAESELIAAAGWSTLSNLVAIKDDAELDMDELKTLLLRVQKTINTEKNRVRYTMNGFVIAVASYVSPLSEFAMKIATKIGKVSVDVGDTECKVPYAPEYILKAQQRGSLEKKRKTSRC